MPFIKITCAFSKQNNINVYIYILFNLTGLLFFHKSFTFRNILKTIIFKLKSSSGFPNDNKSSECRMFNTTFGIINKKKLCKNVRFEKV
jgi:hypothetical protein